jgi:hypothetical protein
MELFRQTAEEFQMNQTGQPASATCCECRMQTVKPGLQHSGPGSGRSGDGGFSGNRGGGSSGHVSKHMDRR